MTIPQRWPAAAGCGGHIDSGEGAGEAPERGSARNAASVVVSTIGRRSAPAGANPSGTVSEP